MLYSLESRLAPNFQRFSHAKTPFHGWTKENCNLVEKDDYDDTFTYLKKISSSNAIMRSIMWNLLWPSLFLSKALQASKKLFKLKMLLKDWTPSFFFTFSSLKAGFSPKRMKRNCLKHGLKFTRFNFLIHYFIELQLHVANIYQLKNSRTEKWIKQNKCKISYMTWLWHKEEK